MERLVVSAMALATMGGFCKGPTFSGKGILAGHKIRGYTQFDVYRGTDLLGFIASDGDKNFSFRVWEGPVKKDAVKGRIEIRYRAAEAGALAARFGGIFASEASYDRVADIVLVLHNPVEHSLEDPIPARRYLNRPDFLAKAYVGSMLRVDKVAIQVETKEGARLKGKLVLPFLSPKGEYARDTAEDAVFFAENAFVGYKLFTPPARAAELASFAFEPEFLHRPAGRDGWRSIEEGGTLTRGDALKIRVRATHACYLYLFNLDSAGNVHLLFPNEKIGYVNPLEGARSYDLPQGADQGFIVDDVKGVEKFVFFVLRQERPEVQALIERVRGGMKAELFKKSAAVTKIRGVSEIRTLSTHKVTPVGASLGRLTIKNFPSDYKYTVAFAHR